MSAATDPPPASIGAGRPPPNTPRTGHPTSRPASTRPGPATVTKENSSSAGEIMAVDAVGREPVSEIAESREFTGKNSRVCPISTSPMSGSLDCSMSYAQFPCAPELGISGSIQGTVVAPVRPNRQRGFRLKNSIRRSMARGRETHRSGQVRAQESTHRHMANCMSDRDFSTFPSTRGDPARRLGSCSAGRRNRPGSRATLAPDTDAQRAPARVIEASGTTDRPHCYMWKQRREAPIGPEPPRRSAVARNPHLGRAAAARPRHLHDPEH